MGRSSRGHLFKNVEMTVLHAFFPPCRVLTRFLPEKPPFKGTCTTGLLRHLEKNHAEPSSTQFAPAITRRSAALGTLCALGTTLLSACSSGKNEAANKNACSGESAEPATGSTFAFDTYCTFTVYGDSAAPAKLSQACARYHQLFDLYNTSSDIARINAAAGAAVSVDPATIDLIVQSLAFCKESDGRFDITIGAVSTLWDFEQGIRPSEADIAAALPHVNWQNVEVDESAGTVRIADPEAKLDLGGIAKGYVADRLCELLEQETDATAAVISLGGNIALFGEKPDGGTWDIGIRDPNDPGGSSITGTAHVDGGSLVTSGLYERTFELDGTTYWHILDPRTGMPVQTDVVSDTVCCPSSLTADALSTTLFVAGSREGAAIADAHDSTAAYFLLENGSTAESSRWQELTDFDT